MKEAKIKGRDLASKRVEFWLKTLFCAKCNKVLKAFLYLSLKSNFQSNFDVFNGLLTFKK